MRIFKQLFEKWACKHEWVLEGKTEYTNGCRYLFVCKKCGKMKTKWV